MPTSTFQPSPPSQDIIEMYAKTVELAAENADPENWKWEDKSRIVWELAQECWQDFNAKWYGDTTSPLDNPLKSPSLSLEPLPTYPSPPSILVRESYVTGFRHVWAQAMAFEGNTGVIITGQLGIGKALFQYYLLVRLLQYKQVVLFSLDGLRLYLFYQCKVYTAGAAEIDGMEPGLQLPVPKLPSSRVFIWSLFDIKALAEPLNLLVYPPCLPVQTASLNPLRYTTWEEEQGPLLTGLPLWTHDELAQGLTYQRKYHSLMEALREVYESPSQSQSDPLEEFPGVRVLLEECEDDTVSLSAKNALDYLLGAVIDRFGYSAHDVFSAVFNYQAVTKLHQAAFKINHADLQTAVSALTTSRIAEHSISSRILTICPVHRGPFMRVGWTVNFKSDWVARSVIQALGEAEDTLTRQNISYFRRIPQAQGIMRWFLEPLVHHSIAGTSTGGFWPLINMASNGADSPRFTVVQGTSPPIPDDTQFAQVKRGIIKFQSIDDLSLKNNKYYIPEDPSFPLFHAFTIELDYLTNSAILWILQITTSQTHAGSARGYQKVRNIIARLKDHLGETPPPKKTTKVAIGQTSSKLPVQIHYLLIVPKGDTLDQWHFPKGWNKHCGENDHRGDVYCLEVPVAVCSIVIKN